MKRSRLPVVVVGLALAACGSEVVDPVEGSAAALSGRTFPNGFTFGSAVAGFQVDMGCPTIAAATCEDRASDWYQYITTKRIVSNPDLHMSGDLPSSGPGFFELYEQDLDRASGTKAGELANTSIRLSIEWSRLFPEPTWGVTDAASLKKIASADGIAFYHRLFAATKARGLKPSVTLNHYTLPLWVHDGDLCNQSLADCIAAGKAGWADPDRTRIVGEIAKYAGFVAGEFGGEVDQWATLNEPLSAVVLPGYLISTEARSNPPGLFFAIDAAKTATTAMIEAHARMYDAIKRADVVDADGDGKPAEVGIVYAFTDIVPASDSPKDALAAEHAQYIFHDLFMDGVAFGRVDTNWDKGPGEPKVRPDIAGRLDFVGVNYYFRFPAKAGPVIDVLSPFLDFDPLAPFEAAPRGIKPTLMRVAQRYGKPLYVTETGSIQDDEARSAAWVVQTLDGVHDAISGGADVRGYFAWSLMDNYEWNQGMKTKMGLYSVDPKTKARRVRESGTVYSEIAATRAISPALEKRYASFFP